ncbi:MAG: hypothetical protein RL362_807, partial [Bacteroidota bacterium]
MLRESKFLLVESIKKGCKFLQPFFMFN